MLETSLYCVITQINPGYTHLDLDLVFYNLPCITEEKSYCNAFYHLRIAWNTPFPTPLCSPLQIKCEKIVSSFSWVLHSFKETLKTILMRTLGGGGKGSVKHDAFWVMGKPLPNHRVPKR